MKNVMIEWAKNVGHNISIEDREQLWKINITFSKAASFKENIYKIFYIWYLFTKFAKMYSGVKKHCWNSQDSTGTFYHM